MLCMAWRVAALYCYGEVTQGEADACTHDAALATGADCPSLAAAGMDVGFVGAVQSRKAAAAAEEEATTCAAEAGEESAAASAPKSQAITVSSTFGN